MTDELIRPGDKPNELLLFDHGFVRLDDAMASDLSVVNSARVSFAVRREAMDDRDKGLIKFLMRERHGTPFEHNSFRFHIRTPIFVAREWFRHRVGCLTGDTVVTFTNNQGATGPRLNKTISELYDIWTVGERNGQGLTQEQERLVRLEAGEGNSLRCIARTTGIGRRAVTRVVSEGTTEWRDGKWRVRRMRLRTLNEDLNEFEAGRICDVVDSGKQAVFAVSLADGKRLKATATHRVLTREGWATLRDAVGLVGEGPEAIPTKDCYLMVNGEPVHTQRDWLARKREECQRRIHATQAAEMAFAASMADQIGFAVDDVDFPQRKGVRLTAHPVRVVSVEFVGIEQTYDLCVEGPWHNFVANGIVVHNSFNEESARYHKLSDDFYVPAPEAVRTQVGKPGSYSFESVEEPLADETIDTFKRIYKDLFAEYEGLIEKGVAKELARAILPFGIYTQFYWTLNARSLMNFLSLRAATAAQYEIRVYAQAVERLFAEAMPITHECFVEFGRRAP